MFFFPSSFVQPRQRQAACSNFCLEREKSTGQHFFVLASFCIEQPNYECNKLTSLSLKLWSHAVFLEHTVPILELCFLPRAGGEHFWCRDVFLHISDEVNLIFFFLYIVLISFSEGFSDTH